MMLVKEKTRSTNDACVYIPAEKPVKVALHEFVPEHARTI